MKRFTAALLLLCLAAALCSCSTFSGPSGVANRFMANLKAYDLEGAGKCLLNPDELDADKSESNVFYDYYKECAKKMKFRISELQFFISFFNSFLYYFSIFLISSSKYSSLSFASSSSLCKSSIVVSYSSASEYV